MNLVPITWFDTWALSASLRRRLKMFAEGEGPIRSLAWPIEGDEWPAAANMMRRISRLPGSESSELGRVAFELLPGGAVSQWEREGGEWQRLHLPIVTNPGALVYAGVEARHLIEGQLMLVNTRAWCSQVNFGDWPRIHLVIDFRPRPQLQSAPADPE